MPTATCQPPAAKPNLWHGTLTNPWGWVATYWVTGEIATVIRQYRDQLASREDCTRDEARCDYARRLGMGFSDPYDF